MDIITYPCCDKHCHSDNSQMYSLIWLLLQQESIWSHSADILSARQYLNQPKDDAIIFSRPPRSLVAYGSGKRMVTGTRAGSRIKTRNFKRRFLPHHKSQRCDIWCTSGPVVSCFSPNFVDQSVPYEVKQRCVKFRRCFGNIPSEFR